MPVKTSHTRSCSSASGCRAPAVKRDGSAVTSTASAASCASASASRISPSRAVNAWFTRPRAPPTSLPSAAFWSLGTSRSDAFSRARVDFSPVCSARTALSAAESAAAAIAARAASTAAATAGSVIWRGSDTKNESSRLGPPPSSADVAMPDQGIPPACPDWRASAFAFASPMSSSSFSWSGFGGFCPVRRAVRLATHRANHDSERFIAR